MKNFSSLIGWLILIGALAVPSFLFYNWMSSKKADQTVQARPVTEQAKFFSSEASAVQSGTDIIPKQHESQTGQSSPQPAQTTVAQVQPIAPQVLQPVSRSSSAPSRVTHLPQSANEQKQPDLAQRAPSQTSTTQALTVSTMSYYAPKTSRDPTLSPGDYEKIREEENMLRMAQKQRELEAKRRQRGESPTVKLKLQGIIGTSAIINGDMVNVGQTIMGFRVTKVGASYVIGVYNGKKYKLSLK